MEIKSHLIWKEETLKHINNLHIKLNLKRVSRVMSERKRRINLLVNVNKNIKVTWTCERWIKKCCKYEILKDTVMLNIQLQLFSVAIRKVILILQLFMYFESHKFSHGEHKSSYDLFHHFKCSSRLHLFAKKYNKKTVIVWNVFAI